MPRNTPLGVGKIGVDPKFESHGFVKIFNQTRVPSPKITNPMGDYTGTFVLFACHRESNSVIQKKIAKIKLIK